MTATLNHPPVPQLGISNWIIKERVEALVFKWFMLYLYSKFPSGTNANKHSLFVKFEWCSHLDQERVASDH